MIDENTQNLDKYAIELSDYLNKANKLEPVTKETIGCGKAMVYRDRFDIVDVDPKTLNIQGYFINKSLDSLFIQKIKEFFPNDAINYQTIKELFQKTNMDIIEFIKNKIQKMNETTKNIKNVEDNVNETKNILENILEKILFGLSREAPGVNIHYNDSMIKDKNSREYIEVTEVPDYSGVTDYRHQVYVYSKYLNLLEKIKKQLETTGTNKDEINIQLLYVLLFCLNTGEETITLFTNFGIALMEMTNKAIIMNRKFDIDDYIKDKNTLAKINNSFHPLYLPTNIYPLNVKLLPIQQLNRNDFDIYITFYKNELLITTYQLLHLNYNTNMMIGVVIDKIVMNITKKTYSNYFEYCWTTKFNTENNNSPFINTLFDTLDKLEQNSVTGGRRRPRKTMKRKKNTTKKRKRIIYSKRKRPKNRVKKLSTKIILVK
jgi:hypothetical protein